MICLVVLNYILVGCPCIDSCFALFGARQYGVTTRDRALMKKYPRTLILALTENS